MIKISTGVWADWLERPDDLRFLKQIGVDCVSFAFNIFGGDTGTSCRLERDSVARVVDKIDAAGLKVERANSSNGYTRATFLGEPGWEQELDDLVHNIEICGEFGFPVVGIQCFQASQLVKFEEPRYRWIEGRGGYVHLQADLADALDQPPAPGAPTHEQLWEGTLKIFRAAVPAAESAGVKVAMHGNDPPVPSICGVPQILYDFDAFDRLFSEVPSPNHGMTFCVGTRYESGQDVFAGIRHFGEQGKLFHVHFRNVVGTIPATGGYAEVIPDDGDLNMFDVASALNDVGYEAAIDYDHLMRLTDDGPLRREYVAFCVGHMRGILQGLDRNS